MMNVPGCGTYIVDGGSGGSVRMEARAYSIEDPQYPLDDPSVWSDGTISASGRRVGPTTALHLPAVYQAVTRISGDVARCPLELYEEKDGAYKSLVDDPLYRLTAIQPNREMDAFKFWQRVMVQRLVWQNAYIFIATSAMGQAAELLPLLSDRTAPKRAGGTLYYETEVNGNIEPIPASRIIHLEGIGFDNLLALDLCRLMRDAFGLALAQMEFPAKVFSKGGRRGGVLELPATMTKPAADRLEEGFRKKYDDDGQWFTTVILRDNAKFHESQMTLRDSQSIEGREESVRDVARAFNIRPGHLGVEASGVYGNKGDDTRDYLDMTLRPHMTGITAQCRMKLLPIARQGRELFWHNTDDLLQMSVKEEFEAYGAGVEKTIITSNEARGKIGLPPIEGGDQLRNPNTMSGKSGGKDLSKSGTKGGTKPPMKPAADDEEEEGEELNAAQQRLLRKHIDAVVAVIGEKADRAAASGAKFLAWLDGKFSAEHDNLARAIVPIAECIAAASGNQSEANLADELTADVFRSLEHGLQQIANTTPEAALRTAVTDYFKHWRVQPCPPQQQNQAA